MKKILFLGIISICATVSAAERGFFWQERVERLEKDKARFANESNARNFIDKEILRCQSMISMFENRRDKAKGSDTIQLTKEDISSLASDTSSHLANIYLLRAILTESATSRNEAIVRQMIAEILEKELLITDKKIILQYLSSIERSDTKTLAIEASVMAYMKIADAAEKSAKKTINDELEFKLGKYNFKVSRKYAEDLAEKAGADYFAKNLMNGFKLDKSALTPSDIKNSEIFLSIMKNATTGFDNQKKLGEILGESELSFDSAIKRDRESEEFRKLSLKLCNTEPFDRINQSALTPKIPKEPDMKAVFSAIDKIRNTSISTLSKGKTGARAKDDAEAAISLLIDKSFKECSDTFFREDEKLKIISSSEPTPEKADNRPFYRSKELFKAKIAGARDYQKASVDYIEIFSRLKKAPDSAGLFTARISSLQKIIDQITQLDSRCEKYHGEPAKIFAALQNNARKFIQHLDSLSAISQTERAINKLKLGEMLEKRSSFSKQCGFAIKSIHDTHENSRGSQKTAINPTNIAPQSEVNALSQSIRERSTIEINNQYTGDAFAKYSAFFEKLSKNPEHSESAQKCKQIIENRSLIPFIAGFDAKRISANITVRNYVIRENESDLAAIAAIKEFERSQKNDIADSLSPDELVRIKSIGKDTRSTKIAGRAMNESNIAEVDRFAAAFIEKKYRRATWENSANVYHETIKTNGLTISVTLPESFSYKKPKFNTAKNPVVKSLADIDNSRKLYIAAGSGQSAEESVRAWILSTGKRPVAKNIAPEHFAFSATASDSSSVMDIYCVEKNGMQFIIAGECPKDKYNFYRTMIQSVAFSIEIDGEK